METIRIPCLSTVWPCSGASCGAVATERFALCLYSTQCQVATALTRERFAPFVVAVVCSLPTDRQGTGGKDILGSD